VSLDDFSDNARGLEGRREPREKGTMFFLRVFPPQLSRLP